MDAALTDVFRLAADSAQLSQAIAPEATAVAVGFRFTLRIALGHGKIST